MRRLAAVLLACVGCGTAVDVPPGSGWWCWPASDGAILGGQCAREQSTADQLRESQAWCFTTGADHTVCLASPTLCERMRTSLVGYQPSDCIEAE